MAMRKAAAYSKKHVVPYTRTSKRKEKAYIKAVPPSNIIKFWMGNIGAFEDGKFPHVLTVFTTENIQIRQNALEACRRFIHKKLEDEFNGQYYFRIIPFAHHVQRENKMLTGAGSDRMQTGMQLSFGKTIAKAAIMKKDEPIFLIAIANPKKLSFVRKVLKQIKSKLPCKTRIVYSIKTT
jgi:large subunit ribosomal protein L10e